MTSTENRNTYLDQVVAQQARLEQDLRSSRPAAAASFAPPPPPPGAPMAPAPKRARVAAQAVSEVPAGGGAPVTGAVEVRVTGFGRWKTVVVPPNAFVVHTRRGRAELTARESRAVTEGASMADISVCAVDSCSVKAPAVGRSAPQSAH